MAFKLSLIIFALVGCGRSAEIPADLIIDASVRVQAEADRGFSVLEQELVPPLDEFAENLILLSEYLDLIKENEFKKIVDKTLALWYARNSP